MKFVVYSRAAMMDAQPPEENWIVISICEQGDFPAIQENEFLRGRLNLQFHDSDVEKPGEILFNEEHAKRILDFIIAHREMNVERVYVHCLMGQARSAAVAAALDKALTGDDSRYFSNGYFKPNMLVFRGVLNECYERGLVS